MYFGETSLLEHEDSNFHVVAEDVIIHPDRAGE